MGSGSLAANPKNVVEHQAQLRVEIGRVNMKCENDHSGQHGLTGFPEDG
jgi:hypothetical protein